MLSYEVEVPTLIHFVSMYYMPVDSKTKELLMLTAAADVDMNSEVALASNINVNVNCTLAFA